MIYVFMLFLNGMTKTILHLPIYPGHIDIGPKTSGHMVLILDRITKTSSHIVLILVLILAHMNLT